MAAAIKRERKILALLREIREGGIKGRGTICLFFFANVKGKVKVCVFCSLKWIFMVH